MTSLQYIKEVKSYGSVRVVPIWLPLDAVCDQHLVGLDSILVLKLVLDVWENWGNTVIGTFLYFHKSESCWPY